jgi:flagellar basal body-associated protein FliL
MKLPKAEAGFSMVIVLVAGAVVLLALTGFGAFYFLSQGFNKTKQVSVSTPLPSSAPIMPATESEMIPTPMPTAVPSAASSSSAISNPVDEINTDNPFATPENPFTGVNQ